MKTATLKKTIAIIASVMLALMFLTPIITIGIGSGLFPGDLTDVFGMKDIDVYAMTYSQLYPLVHSLSMLPIPIIGFKLVLISLIMFGLLVGFAGTAYFGFRTKIKAKIPAMFGIISSGVFLIGVLACSLAAAKYIGAIGGPLKLKFGWGMYLMIAAATAVIVLSIIQFVKGEGYVDTGSSSGPPYDESGPIDPKTLPVRATIVGTAGMFNGSKFDVSDGTPVKFGRDASTCQVVFDQFETAISRVHCTIAYLPSSYKYLIRDNSKNGVFIGSPANRMPKGSEQTVQRGTIIYLGSNKNAFRLD